MRTKAETWGDFQALKATTNRTWSRLREELKDDK
jgi:hypothetical protein